ncbi:NAD-dependent epimerase/dehydratase family protein [Acidithiobacillus sp. M4-SHS-6]|uniref:NAD-dependent epimerase/dehydratase family protein n=1 Tax=Acidithiobacillus sp. M4-SHS-6 TaxID=3383024 RepID=UPI0039BE2B65
MIRQNRPYDVLVMGGSGFLGQKLVQQLAQKAFRVLVSTRDANAAKPKFAQLHDVQVHQVARYDRNTLDTLVSQADAVINLVSIHREIHPSRIDLPPARRGDFEEIHIEIPRRLVHSAEKAGGCRILQVSCSGASPLSSDARLRSKGIGEIIIREASEDSAAQGHFTYLHGPKFVWGARLATTVLRLPKLRSTDLDHWARIIIDTLEDAESIGKIQEVWTDKSRITIYPGKIYA